MTEPARNKVERALAAMREDVWSELQHRRVAKRLDKELLHSKSRRRTWPWWAAGIATAAVIAGSFALRFSAPSSSSKGLALGNELQAARAVLSDGSIVDIDRGGRIQVLSDAADQTRIEVVAGRAEFEVKKRPGRVFSAIVRGVEVRVVGTHFSTELDLTRPPGVVRVKVQRGIVEVAAPHGERVARLGAGDSLEVSLAPGGIGRSLEENRSPVQEPSPTTAPPVPSTSGSTTKVAPPAAPPDASKLFEAASEARRSGNVQAAVNAYAALLRQYPNDERASVAALELGRLRMDTFHANSAAAEAFRRAIATAPNDGIREDALARLVEVLDRTRNRSACRAEQRHYLAMYPVGVHSVAVMARCSDATR